jgi:hypothetical protein
VLRRLHPLSLLDAYPVDVVDGNRRTVSHGVRYSQERRS